MKPLDGITVLDLTRLLPGAVATQILANFGALVIKVEQPGRGDYARAMPIFPLINRGKKSVALDLKDPHGKDAFLRLVDRADVVLEGFRPGVMDRLGLGYEALRERNPRLIYAALTGYGQSGPYAQMAGHDINYLALGGALDPPALPKVQVADLAGGALPAVIGILLALEARHRTGRGQMVDVAMLDGVAALLAVPLTGSEVLTGRYACYHLYQTRDDRWVAVGALEPQFWANLCRGLGCEEFLRDQFAGAARQAEMIGELSRRFRERDAQDWWTLFREQDACLTPVHTVAEAIEDEHLCGRAMLKTDQIGVMPKLSNTPGDVAPAVPLLGEHTREILA